MTVRIKQWFTFGAALFLAAASLSAAPAGDKPADWHSGIGASALVDPFDAADAAAKQAKESLGGNSAKFVMVIAAAPQLVPALIEGVGKHFPDEVIYGCQVTSPLTVFGNHADGDLDQTHGVAVWALGGDVDIAAAWSATDADEDDAYFSAGEKLAAKLKDVVDGSKRPGKLVFTWGDQYNGANKDFAAGMNEGFGDVVPIVGAAAGNQTALEIVKGEIVKGVNVAVLIAGQFGVGMAMNGGAHTAAIADKTLEEAIAQGDGEEPFFALVFNCRRRRQGLLANNQLKEEFDAIGARLKNVDFFGFYGPGEIGAEKYGEPSKGAGFTVTTAVLFAK